MHKRGTAVTSILAIIIAALAVPALAGGSQRTRRLEVVKYRVPAGGAVFPTARRWWCTDGCQKLHFEPGETSFEVELEDAVSPITGGFVVQSSDSDRRSFSYICGQTEEPIEVQEWASLVRLWVTPGPCHDGTPANGIRGEARVTYIDADGAVAPKPPTGPRRQHIETGEYVAPGMSSQLIGDFAVYYICHLGYRWGCVAFHPRGSDRYLSLELKDASGLPVPGYIYQFGIPGSTSDHYVAREIEICGKTEEPIQVHPRTDFIGVVIQAGPCADGTPAAATTGEAIFTFSNRP